MKIIRILASLRITVTLLAMSVFIVFVGTIAQIDHGIWHVVDGYFRTMVAWIPLSVFFPRTYNIPSTLTFPFPGGWLLGSLLAVNLLCALFTRFRPVARGKRIYIGVLFSLAGLSYVVFLIKTGSSVDSSSVAVDPYWRILLQLIHGTAAASILLVGMVAIYGRQCGVVLLHLGVIMLMLSELFTGLFATEGQMAIREGESSDWIEDIRSTELAIVDTSNPKTDTVVAVPYSVFIGKKRINLPGIPFDIILKSYMRNSQIFRNRNVSDDGRDMFIAKEIPHVRGVESGGQVDMPSGYFELLRKPDGESLGTFLLSVYIEDGIPVSVDGKTYLLYLRFERTYKPYNIQLFDFRYDRYPGTDIPKNYSSDILLTDAERNVKRHVRISMNNPLRYRGDTLYQASFAPDERGTVLQVVTNRTWLLPYVSCMVVATGMLVQFALSLSVFISKRNKR